jgi:ribosomal protein S18 acetylase RimI-like enzyme
MRDVPLIKPATPADAEVVAVLLYSAYTHTPLAYPLPADATVGWLTCLQVFFGRPGNRFSYQYTQVAHQDDQIIGAVVSFGGRDEPRLNAAVGSWLIREAQDDEWYIDALAVFTPWERQGIGTRLLQAAEQQARQHHYPNIALHVAQGNQRAIALYTQLHYVVTEDTFLYGQPHVRMVKELA